MKKKTYGELPCAITNINVECTEMMYYQYLPIKLSGSIIYHREQRLMFTDELLDIIIDDFKKNFGVKEFINSYIYLTVKNLFQIPGKPFNRPGWHSDGFMTDDINYIWSDSQPTIFNNSEFTLSQDHKKSIIEMDQQAKVCNNIQFANKHLLRLNQYNIHKVSDITNSGMRLFIKVSFSKDKYDLEGNSHNHQIHYNWNMKPRDIDRNIPQSKIKQ